MELGQLLNRLRVLANYYLINGILIVKYTRFLLQNNLDMRLLMDMLTRLMQEMKMGNTMSISTISFLALIIHGLLMILQIERLKNCIM